MLVARTGESARASAYVICVSWMCKQPARELMRSCAHVLLIGASCAHVLLIGATAHTHTLTQERHHVSE